jgi:hypothetical protein
MKLRTQYVAVQTCIYILLAARTHQVNNSATAQAGGWGYSQSAFTPTHMKYTKYEHTHATEDCANRSRKKSGINWFNKFYMADLL